MGAIAIYKQSLIIEVLRETVNDRGQKTLGSLWADIAASPQMCAK